MPNENETERLARSEAPTQQPEKGDAATNPSETLIIIDQRTTKTQKGETSIFKIRKKDGTVEWI